MTKCNYVVCNFSVNSMQRISWDEYFEEKLWNPLKWIVNSSFPGVDLTILQSARFIICLLIEMGKEICSSGASALICIIDGYHSERALHK